MNVDFTKTKFQELLDSIEFYEANEDKIKQSIVKALKYAKELNVLVEAELKK